MTKIYLVLAFKVDDYGMMIKNQKYRIHEVFTNRRLANNAVDYLNENWKKGFSTKNFRNVEWYTIQYQEISHENYKKLSY